MGNVSTILYSYLIRGNKPLNSCTLEGQMGVLYDALLLRYLLQKSVNTLLLSRDYLVCIIPCFDVVR